MLDQFLLHVGEPPVQTEQRRAGIVIGQTREVVLVVLGEIEPSAKHESRIIEEAEPGPHGLAGDDDMPGLQIAPDRQSVPDLPIPQLALGEATEFRRRLVVVHECVWQQPQESGIVRRSRIRVDSDHRDEGIIACTVCRPHEVDHLPSQAEQHLDLELVEVDREVVALRAEIHHQSSFCMVAHRP
jgi:hypothetical protein